MQQLSLKAVVVEVLKNFILFMKEFGLSLKAVVVEVLKNFILFMKEFGLSLKILTDL